MGFLMQLENYSPDAKLSMSLLAISLTLASHSDSLGYQLTARSISADFQLTHFQLTAYSKACSLHYNINSISHLF